MAHLYPSREAGGAFLARFSDGPVTMLNLIRLRDVADYSEFPELAPAAPISGIEAFERYIAHAEPFLARSGGGLIFLGRAGRWLIGPEEERWDLVMLVRQKSAAAFVSFETDAAYMRGLGHRQAAIVDSRLLPIAAETGPERGEKLGFT